MVADTETPSISKLPGKAVDMLISDELAQQIRTRPDWISEALARVKRPDA